MSKDYFLFILTTVLMALHVIYSTIQANESLLFSFSLFVFPYLVVSSIWYKLKEIYKLSITIIFIVLELNYLATDTIPGLITKGINSSTLDAIFYIPSILLLFTIFIILVFTRVREKRG